MAVKLVQTGEREGREVSIDVCEFVIGRDPSCQLQVDHPRVSPRHCRVRRERGRYFVEDLDSMVGTEVNECYADDPIEIHHGDRLKVGPARYLFLITVEAAETRRQLPPAEPAPVGIAAEPAPPSLPAPPPPPAPPPSPPLRRDADESGIVSLDTLADEALKDVGPHTGPRAEGSTPPYLKFLSRAPGREGRDDWRRFSVVEERGIALVKLLDLAVVNDADIGDTIRELKNLLDTGRNRIVLNLANVTHLSSQVVGGVFHVYRQCRAGGGMLKICKVRPEVAEVFSITGVERLIEIYPDERAAIESGWPTPSPSVVSPPTPSPIGVIEAEAERPVKGGSNGAEGRGNGEAIPGGRPAHQKSGDADLTPLPSTDTPGPQAAKRADVPAVKPGDPPARSDPTRVRLVVMAGSAKGRIVEIDLPRFLIGRDPDCQLRSSSSYISKVHTIIERREGRVFVRDSGSKNGTMLNDRTLLGEEAEAFDGDRLEVWPLQFRFAIESRGEAPPARRSEGPSGDRPLALDAPNPAKATAPTVQLATWRLAEYSETPAANSDADVRATSVARLKVVKGRPEGASISLPPGPFMIGRDPACQLRPKHELVGFKHCLLLPADDGLLVRDLGTESGTLLNGQRLAHCGHAHARHGDRVQIGNLTFEITIDTIAIEPGPRIVGPDASAPASVALTSAAPAPGQEPAPVPDLVALDSGNSSLIVAPAGDSAISVFTAGQSGVGMVAPPIDPVLDTDTFDSTIVEADHEETAASGPAFGTHLRVESIEGIPVVTIMMRRVLDEAATRELWNELREFARWPRLTRVILNFEMVKALSPIATAALTAFNDRLRTRAAVLKFCEVAPDIHRVLEAQGLTSQVSVHFDCHEAIWSSWAGLPSIPFADAEDDVEEITEDNIFVAVD